jgi:hypothetical protein
MALLSVAVSARQQAHQWAKMQPKTIRAAIRAHNAQHRFKPHPYWFGVRVTMTAMKGITGKIIVARETRTKNLRLVMRMDMKNATSMTRKTNIANTIATDLAQRLAGLRHFAAQAPID